MMAYQMWTTDGILKERDEKWKERFAPQDNDGLLVRGIKLLFGCRCWRCTYQGLLPRILRMFGWSKKYESRSAAESCVYFATDCYILITTVVLLLSYFVVFLVSTGDGVNPFLCGVIWFFSACSAYRLIEVFSVMAELHTSERYTTQAPARAIANTLWHFLELTIAFGTFYLLAAWATQDTFSSSPDSLASDWFNALYFSFVTVTTLGYGDFSPVHFLGKLLVVLEVFLGLVLLILVIQRAIAASMNSQPKE